MKWIEVCIESGKDITDNVSMVLLEAGASGTQIQNPDEIRSLIDAAGAKELADYGDFSHILDKYRVTAYFDTGIDLDSLKGALNERFDNFDFLWREADDSEWAGNWKKYYKPFNLTETIRVVPSWEMEGCPDENTIVMDPGMAFGTGTHESTALCAALIEEALNSGDIVLDIGTGTGILSILAARRKAAFSVALDIDPAAVKTAKENFKANNVENAFVYCGELKELAESIQKKEAKAAFPEFLNKAPFEKGVLEGSFDLIAANIVSDVIIALAMDMKKLLKEGGSLVCSGIIHEREEDVLAALDAAGFTNPDIRRKNEWTAIQVNA